ncbi:hypothetical protein Purlil1_9252 [Purpureocillium lilacinum]|uniref:Uncharacterized protein n=1 Tax=Purpureocillium lilacinum TaxID=33203 RepID=A0ABR0BR43_PURLI|nr:hypothetical protein Purlil1_9252 [Purpureocillium lilacinum]
MAGGQGEQVPPAWRLATVKLQIRVRAKAQAKYTLGSMPSTAWSVGQGRRERGPSRHLHADATSQPASQPSTPSVRDTQRTRATTGFGSTQGGQPGSWGLESNAHGRLLRARLAKPTGAGGRKPRLVGT